MNYKKGDSILFIGDSITDTGRARPVGRAPDGLGNGYVRDIWANLWARYPELELEILNLGIGGNRVTDLAERWQSDVLDLQPQHLCIYIGINDVWRHFDRPEWTKSEQVDEKTFRQIYSELVAKSVDKVESLTLMTPFLAETNPEDEMKIMTLKYASIVREVASEYYADLIDLQIIFDNYLEIQPVSTIVPDRVHPNAIGHRLIAQAFLKGSADEVDF